MLSYVDNRHADTQYESELKALILGLDDMRKGVAEQFTLLQNIPSTAQSTDMDAKAQSKTIDKHINQMQGDIDVLVHNVISKRTPQLTELRFILSASKIAGQLERMGDHCKNTIKRMLRVQPHINPKMWDTMMEIVRHVAPSIRGLEAVMMRYTKEAADTVCVSDDAVDSSYKSLVANVSEALKAGALPNERVVDVLFIAKNLERLADHATAIAREYHYIHSGQRA